MKRTTFILSRYIAGQYLFSLLSILGGLFALIYMLDVIELLRRAGKADNVPISVVLEMGLFKLPEVGQIILPFAILFSGLYTFWSLTKRYELAVIRAAGLSVWQFLLPVLAVGFLCGITHISLINPLSALLLERFEHYETKYLGQQKNLVSVFQDGFWIRERETKAGDVILHAEKIDTDNWQFKNVMGLSFNTSSSLTSRLDAASARLEDHSWVFQDVHISQKSADPIIRDEFRLETKLTRQDLEESFAKAETISFWKLRSYIKTLDATGFDSTKLLIHFHYLLSLPVFFIAMIILAASVSLTQPRSNMAFFMIVSGIGLGLVVFFLSSYLQAMGASGQIPPVLAAWSPALITLLTGVTALLILEDG